MTNFKPGYVFDFCKADYEGISSFLLDSDLNVVLTAWISSTFRLQLSHQFMKLCHYLFLRYWLNVAMVQSGLTPISDII